MIMRITPRALRARRRRLRARAGRVGSVLVTVTVDGQPVYRSDLDHVYTEVLLSGGRVQRTIYGVDAGRGFTMPAEGGQSLLDILPRLVLSLELP